jgi:Chaperone of endosialidase
VGDGTSTAEGNFALANLSSGGVFNTALGYQALEYNTFGSQNTADGFEALFSSTGSDNTAVGFGALINNSSGNTNVAFGSNAGQNLTTGSNNIDIGANVLGAAAEANTIRIGNQGTQKSTFIAGIAGTPMSGSTVVVNSTGKLGVATSSARFKEAIKPMDKASEAILALKPVTFRYKEEVDPDRAPQFGLVAEDVEKVERQLIVHDEQGKPFTVRYEAINAMLLNEFLKEHRKVQQLEANALEQQKEIKALAATVKQQASQIQKVSAKIELSKAAPQTVVNNQ